MTPASAESDCMKFVSDTECSGALPWSALYADCISNVSVLDETCIETVFAVDSFVPLRICSVSAPYAFGVSETDALRFASFSDTYVPWSAPDLEGREGKRRKSSRMISAPGSCI